MPLFLLVPLVIQLGDQYLHLVPRHDFVHPVLGLDYLKLPKMFSEILGRDVDPKDPLSNIDLAKFLMHDSTSKVRELKESIDERLRLDRINNNKIVEVIVTGFGKRLDVLEGFAIKCKADLKTIQEELDLKLTTLSSYQEELIHSIQSNVHELQHSVKLCQEMRLSIVCELCGTFFSSHAELSTHLLQHHTLQTSFPCTLCGYVFDTENNFRNHLCRPCVPYMQSSNAVLHPNSVQCHLVQNSVSPNELFNCDECNTLFTSSNDLGMHISQNHDRLMLVHCHFCEQTFPTMQLLNVHTLSSHGSSRSPSCSTSEDQGLNCNKCGSRFSTTNLLRDHICVAHDNPHLAQDCDLDESEAVFLCDDCGITFQSQLLLNYHMLDHDEEHNHNTCHVCGCTFDQSNDLCVHILNVHTKPHHSPNSEPPTPALGNASVDNEKDDNDDKEQDISDQSDQGLITPDYLIPQVDGNDSLTTNDSETVSLGDVDIPSRSSQDMIFNYSLNPKHQTNRLISGATRPPLSVTYSNIQTIHGIQCALYASVECNSGVYLTAIKPTLQSVTDGWRANIDDWTVSCTKVSDRHDNSGAHLLSTQLKLNISKEGDTTNHQLTLHFYHTNDKILLQSSSVISPGVSAATWLVKNFVEPLAAHHVTTNQQSINQINNAILSSPSPVTSRSWTCSFCSTNIALTSNKAKDQPLACKNCRKVFHKKCTNRSGARSSNWNKEPWFCPSCSTPSNVLPRPRPEKETNDHTNSILLPRQRQYSTTHIPGTQLTSLQEEDDSIQSITPTNLLRPPAQTSSPQQNLSINRVPAASTSPAQTTRYPNNSIRQRNSNIAVMSPQQEFEKAALDACRGTIAQQEADIRTLKESLDLRNKKIMQLEGQVGVAKSYMSSRDTPHTDDNHVVSEQHNKLLTSLSLLLAKLNTISDNLNVKSQEVNVYNSTCHLQKPHIADKTTQTHPNIPKLSEVLNQEIQTEPENLTETEIILTCTHCLKTFQTNGQLDDHMERSHENNTTKSKDQQNLLCCDFCDLTFSTTSYLQAHISTNHATDYFSCDSCKLRFQAKQDLDKHKAASHQQLLQAESANTASVTSSLRSSNL